MKSVFIVLSLTDGEIDTCLVYDYADIELAFEEAEEHANYYAQSKPEWVVKDPKPVEIAGLPVWTFLDTSKHSVKVVQASIKDSFQTMGDMRVMGATGATGAIGTTGPQGPSFASLVGGALSSHNIHSIGTGSVDFGAKDGSYSPPPSHVVMQINKVTGNLEPVVVDTKAKADDIAATVAADPHKSFIQKLLDSPPADEPKDDPFAPDLPAGWNLARKPIRISDLLEYPQDVMDLLDVSEDHVWALVIARISKREHYVCHMNSSMFTFSRDKVIQELKDRTDFGLRVRDFEIELLEDFINLNATK